MTLLLVRHADAGDRAAWDGDDRRRPLSELGRAQASAIVGQYADRRIDRILTSPYLRCIETVAPLAAVRGLDTEEEDLLAEGTPPDLVWRLLRRLADTHAVLCSHGDVVEAVVRSVVAQAGAPAGALVWVKASTWVLDLDGGVPDGAGATVTAAYLPPPA